MTPVANPPMAGRAQVGTPPLRALETASRARRVVKEKAVAAEPQTAPRRRYRGSSMGLRSVKVGTLRVS